jgi:hypothetical protein
MTTSQAAYHFKDERNGKNKCLMHDVGFATADLHQLLTEKQFWTYKGEPFSPIFVVEVDTLTDRLN